MGETAHRGRGREYTGNLGHSAQYFCEHKTAIKINST